MITVLAGGVGAARMLRGLRLVLLPGDLTAVVNTGDDTRLHGLHISPDLDTVLYTLSGRSDEERGWGLAGETWAVMGALETLGGETWFSLGDHDLATHLYRTGRLEHGATLSTVTEELARSFGVDVRLLPMSDDPVRTRLTLEEGTEVAFQDYFVRLRHAVAVTDVTFAGADVARPAPGVLDALVDAELLVICPSNPIVSIGPILAVPGVRSAVVARRESVVAVSPIIAGAALKGPADRLLTELGFESSVLGVAAAYRELAGTLVIDEVDAPLAAAVENQGMRCVVAPTIMSTPERAAALATVVLGACPPQSSGNRL
jgi:LPPG:FO 2-phospho-L-lactate transferase